MRERYSGSVRLIDAELAVPYGEGKVIFIEHMNDLFADGVSRKDASRILEHCVEWPENEYVFQTKDPDRLWEQLSELPKNSMIGTTIETDRDYPIIRHNAPPPWIRARALRRIREDTPGSRFFVTVEPVLDFNPGPLASLIIEAGPTFVNIGADSKRSGLPEPRHSKVLDLIVRLQAVGIEIRQKRNLERLLVKV